VTKVERRVERRVGGLLRGVEVDVGARMEVCVRVEEV
jgi:hypothetical protein